MPSLTASFVDVLDQSVNFTHLVPGTMSSTSSSLLLPNLPRNWWQISSSLRARPQRLSSSVIFSVHMLTPSTSLILKHVVGSASGAHGAHDWQRRSSSSTRGCVRSLVLRGCAARAVCARTRQPMLTLAVRALLPDHSSPLSIACQDGAQPSAVNNLFLRSRLCSPRLGGVAQPSGHPRARCMHSNTLQSRAPRRSGAGNTRLMTAGRPQSSVHSGHQSLWLRSFRVNQSSI